MAILQLQSVDVCLQLVRRKMPPVKLCYTLACLVAFWAPLASGQSITIGGFIRDNP
jgi:hypothetical protein